MNKNVQIEVSKTLNSGFITQGPKVEEFENKLKEYFGTELVLSLNSGTSGLSLALRLLFEPGNYGEFFENWPGFDKTKDIVLTPALTCFATTASILTQDVNIKWLDIEQETCCIDYEDLRTKLDYNTKIIYVVHWGGTPCDIVKLSSIQDEHFKKYGYRPMIVEDCAHAFGAMYNSKLKVGCNNRNICVFSLQAIKHLTTGDGGIITLPHKTFYERAKLLRWYGIDRDKRNYKNSDFRLENDILEAGYKYHMNDLNATIGLVNLEGIGDIIEKNRYNANYLNFELKNVVGLKVTTCPDNVKSAYWLFTIMVDNKEDFMEKMKACDVMVSQVHNRNDIYSCVDKYKISLPQLDIIEKKMVCIPVGWWLTENDLKHIVSSIKSGW